MPFAQRHQSTVILAMIHPTLSYSPVSPATALDSLRNSTMIDLFICWAVKVQSIDGKGRLFPFSAAYSNQFFSGWKMTTEMNHTVHNEMSNLYVRLLGYTQRSRAPIFVSV
jgi:hypothetical protein